MSRKSKKAKDDQDSTNSISFSTAGLPDAALDKGLIGTKSMGNNSLIHLVCIVFLILTSFAVYFNALSGDFVYDDESQIVDNPWIRDISNIPTIFSRSVWSFQSGAAILQYYRPL